MLNKQVLLLTNFVPPYRTSLFEAVERQLGNFEILLSTEMESNRNWPTVWNGLRIEVQRSLTLKRIWYHPKGFSEENFIHLPFDTLYKLIQKRPDVVISGELGLRSLQAALYRLLFPKSRLILWATVSEQSELGRGRVRQVLRRLLVHRADAILVNGESGARYIKRFKVDEQRIARVPYTTNMVPFFELPIAPVTEGPLCVLMIGQLIERKGILPFLTHLSTWAEANPHRELELIFAGDGPLKAQIRNFSLGNNIQRRFLGSISYPELPSVYRQAHLLAFPTLADEWGVVVNEAMASGLPILGSRYSQAVEELVEEGISGWIFRPDQPDEVLTAMDRAFSVSDVERQQMGRAARNRMKGLTPEFAARQILFAVELVLKKPFLKFGV